MSEISVRRLLLQRFEKLLGELIEVGVGDSVWMERVVAEPADVANGTKPVVGANGGVAQCPDDQRIEPAQVVRGLKGEANGMELHGRQAQKVAVCCVKSLTAGK